MKIFIMRHGEAEMWARSDDARQLTARGKLQAAQQGEFLKTQEKKGALFDKVLVSPYVRARETFAEINQQFNNQLAPHAEIWQGITPYGNASTVVDYLELLRQQGVQQLLLISHLPLVDEIVRAICGRSEVSFYPATLAEIDWQGQKGQFIRAKYTD